VALINKVLIIQSVDQPKPEHQLDVIYRR